MPKKTIRRPSSSRAREIAYRRKVQQIKRRKGDKGKRPGPPRILSNSIFALTLDPKPGIEVQSNLKGKKSALRVEDDYYKMYADLFPIMINAVKIATGNETKYDPLMDGRDIGWSLGYLVQIFKHQVLPKDFDMRIDYDDEIGYHFTIYRYCPFNDFWHAFEIKPVVDHLKQISPRLHDLFISFIKYMASKTGIETWWSGSLSHAEYMLEEEVFDWEERVGPITTEPGATKQQKKDAAESAVQYEKANGAIKSYKSGEAKKYQKLIQGADDSRKKILSGLARTKLNHPIVDWMARAMDWMEKPGCIDDYMYRAYFDDENIEGLMFDQQIAILWDWDDAYSRLQGECLDSEAQGIGIHPPLLHFHFTTQTQKIDLEDLKERLMWPSKITDIWKGYATIVEKLKKKTKANGRKK